MPKAAILETTEQFTPSSRADWRSWLERHHTNYERIWLVFYKKATGKKTLSYAEAVEEALCFGWVDSLPRTLDDERHMLLFTVRKPKSPWSRPNKIRVEALIAAGLMTPAGLEKIQIAKQNGAWESFDAAEDLLEPQDLTLLLNKNPAARSNWDTFAPSARKGILFWLSTAKRQETRQKRLLEIVQKAEINKKANFPNQ
jgi:uncharacterized protein YdeI (YjbR/CyaY-like superfamily)